MTQKKESGLRVEFIFLLRVTEANLGWPLRLIIEQAWQYLNDKWKFWFI